jgi:hypothetical protein
MRQAMMPSSFGRVVDVSQSVNDGSLDFIPDIRQLVLHQVGLPGSILVFSEAVALSCQFTELIVAAPSLDTFTKPQCCSYVGARTLCCCLSIISAMAAPFSISGCANPREGYNELMCPKRARNARNWTEERFLTTLSCTMALAASMRGGIDLSPSISALRVSHALRDMWSLEPKPKLALPQLRICSF